MPKLILYTINKFFAKIFPFAMKVEGKWVFYNSFDRFVTILLWKFNLLEKNEINLFKSFLKPGMVVLDIGANLGIYSILSANLLKGTGKIIAFEPDKQHCATISKSINKNKITNIELHNKAVGNSAQYLILKKDQLNSGNYQVQQNPPKGEFVEGEGLRPSLKKGSMDELVEIVALDHFLKEISQVDLVKMDIQGFEYFALQGMQEIIKKNEQCIIFCEYWPSGLKENNISGVEFLQLIVSLNLNIFSFDKNNNKLNKINPEDFLNMNDLISYKNIILSKKNLIN